jgi:hypothetical protein
MQQRQTKTAIYPDGGIETTFYAYDAPGVLMGIYTNWLHRLKVH